MGGKNTGHNQHVGIDVKMLDDATYSVKITRTDEDETESEDISL